MSVSIHSCGCESGGEWKWWWFAWLLLVAEFFLFWLYDEFFVLYLIFFLLFPDHLTAHKSHCVYVLITFAEFVDCLWLLTQLVCWIPCHNGTEQARCLPNLNAEEEAGEQPTSLGRNFRTVAAHVWQDWGGSGEILRLITLSRWERGISRTKANPSRVNIKGQTTFLFISI